MTGCGTGSAPSSGPPPETALVQFRMERRDGTWCDVEAVVTDQRDRPSVGGYVANIRDITERKEFEALLAHRALHDPLTGLANRQLILDRAEQMLVRSRRTCEPVAAYFIDLDNFKDANDSLGHEAGDKLLQVGGRPVRRACCGPATPWAGWAATSSWSWPRASRSSAGPEMVAERIREVLREPFLVDGFEGLPITVTASIGIATGDRAVGPGAPPRRRHRPLPGQGRRPGPAASCSSRRCRRPPSTGSS